VYNAIPVFLAFEAASESPCEPKCTQNYVYGLEHLPVPGS